MDLKNLLNNPLTIKYADSIANQIIEEPEFFEQLFELIFDSNKTISWRAGWVCDKISRVKPEWFTKKHINKIQQMFLSEKHNGTLRSLLSIFNNLYTGWQLDTPTLNFLYNRMILIKSDVSHQVLSMKIITRLCEREPALIPELQAYLEFISPEDFTQGFNSCRKKTFKFLKKKQLSII